MRNIFANIGTKEVGGRKVVIWLRQLWQMVVIITMYSIVGFVILIDVICIIQQKGGRDNGNI